MKNLLMLKNAAVCFLIAVTTLPVHAEVNVSEINDYLRLIPIMRTKFAQTIESENLAGDLGKLLNHSDSNIVVMTLDYLDETTAKSAQLLSALSAEQKLSLTDKRRALLKSEFPVIRLLAFRSLVAQSYASRNLALFNELKANISNENQARMREWMATQVAHRDESFRDLQIVLPSADWCGPCNVLKSRMTKEGLPLAGTLKVTVRGQSMQVSYRFVDADKQTELFDSLGLAPILPSVNLVKNGHAILLEHFSSSKGRPLTVEGLRATVEAVLSSYLE